MLIPSGVRPLDFALDTDMQDNEESVNALVEAGDELIESIYERRPYQVLKALIDQGAPLWYQDEDGNSALHAAVHIENLPLTKLLLEQGAVWNLVDNLGNTAGDVALSLNNEDCYREIRDTGLRSEFLLSHLASKNTEVAPQSGLLLRSQDNTAAGSSTEFLKSKLVYRRGPDGQEICAVKSGNAEVGVMMGWEKEIMQETVKQMYDGMEAGYSVLNVGFGLGIIDSLFQALPIPPTHHYIIEAHPDVLQHMRELGWYEKPGVKIFEGKWQDFIDSGELLALGGFDIVYTDTFSEDYKALHDFFEELPNILNGPKAKFSFFNGLGATNALFYDVYTQLSELHLKSIGVDVIWSDMDVVGDDAHQDKWDGTRNYFGMRLYRLPIGRLID